MKKSEFKQLKTGHVISNNGFDYLVTGTDRILVGNKRETQEIDLDIGTHLRLGDDLRDWSVVQDKPNCFQLTVFQFMGGNSDNGS